MTVAVILAALALAAVGCSRPERAGEHDHADPGVSRTPPVHATQGKFAAEGQVPGMAPVDVPFERRQAIGVRTARVERRPLSARIRTVGVVAEDERGIRKVHTKISGWVENLFVSFTGQYVNKGDKVLSIYSPELVATQREYLLALSAAGARASGQSGIGEDVTRLLVESARKRLQLWDVTEEQVNELERTGAPARVVTLHSPISGYVTVKPVFGGVYVTPEMELYTVSDLATVWVWADVYENEAALVRVGQPATITINSAPNSTLATVVSYVNPTMEIATRTVRVRFDVNNLRGRLKPGMYATVELETALGDVLALPEDALIDTGERKIVFVQTGESTYQPRAVRLGQKADAYYEVLGGLSDGERVVVSAQFLLDSESRLRGATGGGRHRGH